MLRIWQRIKKTRANETRRTAVSPGVQASHNEEGLILLDVGNGTVYKANAIGARIWREVVVGRNRAQCVAGIASHYGVSPERIESDINLFLRELTGKGLIQEVSAL